MLRSLLLLAPIALFAVDGPAVKAGHDHAATINSRAVSDAPAFLAVRAPRAKALAGSTSVTAVGALDVPAFLAVRSPQAKALAGSTSVPAVGAIEELPWLKVRRQGGKLRL